jgi:hypothetical protein
MPSLVFEENFIGQIVDMLLESASLKTLPVIRIINMLFLLELWKAAWRYDPSSTHILLWKINFNWYTVLLHIRRWKHLNNLMLFFDKLMIQTKQIHTSCLKITRPNPAPPYISFILGIGPTEGGARLTGSSAWTTQHFSCYDVQYK